MDIRPDEFGFQPARLAESEVVVSRAADDVVVRNEISVVVDPRGAARGAGGAGGLDGRYRVDGLLIDVAEA